LHDKRNFLVWENKIRLQNTTFWDINTVFFGRAASLRSRRAIRSITFALISFRASVVPLLSLSQARALLGQMKNEYFAP
jgi:hypothetical protein